ncbi:MAG: glycerol-3-phosphate 1-O-acyltransferase PlsY [Planctomycetes bacterium]|nr:glycerol-3-phosphate 1-O-acyltransferase PlsY [Planctomycetota bacterium]
MLLPCRARRGPHSPMPLVLALLASYLLGSIPFGLVLVRLAKGIDLRSVGSGNIGATNAMRAAGKPVGLAVFVLDFAKGWVAVFAFAGLLAQSEPLSWTATACGAASVLGHCFPLWLRFAGGKGVATGCGVLVALDPWIWAVGGAVWLATLAGGRMVSLASIAMGLAFPVAAWLLTARAEPTAAAALLALLILVRHRSNMARIVAGTESKIGAKRAAAPGAGGG